MTPEQLRASILQYAIQGKLVEQRPEEGTGEELYQQIQVKKQTLIKEGKVKKEKPFSKNPAYQDYPFDIPDTWKFVRFGELLITRDSERVPVSVSDRNKRAKIYDYYGASGIIDKIDDYLFDDELLLIGEDGANLLSRSTPIAFIAKGKYWVNNHAHVLDACCNLNLNYICYHINAISLAPYVTGTAQPKMNQENMNAIWIALPPLEEQHRIVAKIEELLPYVDRYAVAYEKLEQFNTKFPENMKKSILRYAIQGKLVEQRAEEGTGEELYQQIQAEKQRLIQEKKIKKEKPLPEITEDEKPFDIPESWIWVRLSQIWSILNGDRGKNYPAKSTLSKTGIPFISAINLNGKTVVEDENLLCLSQIQYDKLVNGKLQKNDVVVCIRGSLGKHGVYPFDQGAIASSLVILRNYFFNICDDEFLLLYLDSPLFFSEIKKYDNGTAQPNLAAKSLEQFLIPLPPLYEQKRIVAKIEELLPLVDRYAVAYEKLEQFNTKFPEDMKRSILQYAIQGKLVEQRAEEGTGEELYQQIQAKKQRLVKEGKIKKEKPLPEITEDEVPFDIPESWAMVRFGSVVSLLSGTDFKPEDYNNQGEGTVYITGASNLSEEGVIVSRWTETPRNIANRGDVLLVCKGSGYGKTVICDVDEAHIARQIMAVKKTENMSMAYIRYFLQANIQFIKSKGQGVIPGIDRATVLGMAFPIPPLAEQKRIVAKIEELLPLCERLK